MRYRIRHRTSYEYAAPAWESFNELRLQPLTCATQTCLDFELEIDPPATVISFRDYYGNAVHDFGVPYLHERLRIEASSDVVTAAAEDEPLGGPRGGEDASPPLATLREDGVFADEFAEFLGPSAYIPLDVATADLTATLLADRPVGGETAYAFLVQAGTHVRSSLEYRLGTTRVDSSVAEILDLGSGVCQDFAHVLISICRHAGLPARYVSGYLGNVASSTASHAWVEAFVPPWGWIGYDATAGTAATGRHVMLAVGRDYADVTVLRGTYQGGGEATLEVQVESETLGSHGSPAAVGGGVDRARGQLIQFQDLGAMRQFQRAGGGMQTLGTMTQSFGPYTAADMPSQRLSADQVPSQQPQQQQQAHGSGTPRTTGTGGRAWS